MIRKPVPDDILDEVRALYESGLSIPAVALRLGYSYGGLHKFFVKHGIPRRDPYSHRGKRRKDRDCQRCRETKHIDLFVTWKDGHRVYHFYCSDCREARRERLELRKQYLDAIAAVPDVHAVDGIEVPEREVAQHYTTELRGKFPTHSATEADFWLLLTKQNRRCAICKIEHRSAGIQRSILHIDHRHETGRLRGLLCQRCNTAVGNMDDDPARLRRAADYLTANAESSDAQRTLPFDRVGAQHDRTRSAIGASRSSLDTSPAQATSRQ